MEGFSTPPACLILAHLESALGKDSREPLEPQTTDHGPRRFQDLTTGFVLGDGRLRKRLSITFLGHVQG